MRHLRLPFLPTVSGFIAQAIQLSTHDNLPVRREGGQIAIVQEVLSII